MPEYALIAAKHRLVQRLLKPRYGLRHSDAGAGNEQRVRLGMGDFNSGVPQLPQNARPTPGDD